MNDIKEFDQKVLKYLETRKTAATTKQIAKFFIRSESAISASMKRLCDQGLVKYIRSSGTKFYALNS